MKRNLVISLTVLVLLVTLVFMPNAYAAENIPVASNKFVNDFANVINDDTEASMLARAEALLNRYNEGVQVMVVTVESLNGESIESYALRMYNTYGIGKKDVNIGVMILVSVNDRKTRVATGAGTEEIITNKEATEFAKIGNDFFRRGEFGAGLEAIQIAVIDELNYEMQKDTNATIEASSESVITSNDYDQEVQKDSGGLWINLFCVATVGIFVSLYIYAQFRSIQDKLYAEADRRYDAENNARHWEAEYHRLEEELEENKKKYAFAVKYVDKELDKKIDRKVAEIFDGDVRRIMESKYDSNDYSSVSALMQKCENLLEQYKKLTDAQKKQVTLLGAFKDFIAKLSKEESALKVKILEEEMSDAVKRRASYSSLRSIRNRYLDLSSSEKAVFDAALYSNFNVLYNRKESDYEYHNRRTSSYSDTVDDNSWSYSDSGDGGCSDGGGGSSDW